MTEPKIKSCCINLEKEGFGARNIGTYSDPEYEIGLWHELDGCGYPVFESGVRFCPLCGKKLEVEWE